MNLSLACDGGSEFGLTLSFAKFGYRPFEYFRVD